MWKTLLPILIAAPILFLLLLWSQHRNDIPKVSGFVESDEIRVGSRVGGRVARVIAEEGREVKKGDVLLELEPFQLIEQKAQAAAQLVQAKAELERVQAGFRSEEIAQVQARRDQLKANLDKLVNGPRAEDIRAAESQLNLSKSQYELAKITQSRNESLLARGAKTQSEVDQSATELRVSQATVKVREEELAKLKSGNRPEEIAEARAQFAEAEAAYQLQKNGYRKEELAKAKAAVEAADAALRAIDRQMDELTVKSPVNGIVEAVELRPGDLVGANVNAISIQETARLWVRAYVPESRLNLHEGDELFLSTDSSPGKKFKGHVSFVARQGEFIPGNVQTPEDRSKQVFRIKVMIDEGRDALRPGMVADVWLDRKAS